ncbi:MAG: Fe-S cluster assembly protein SufD [Gemmatimonadales bacterium]
MTRATIDKKRYLSDFKTFLDNGASNAPAWLQKLRKVAVEQFERVGFPTTRDERWRFTNLSALAKTPFDLAPDDGEILLSRADLLPHRLDMVAGHEIVFVNGRFKRELSQLDGLPEGVIVSDLAGAVADEVEPVTLYLAQYAEPADNPFTALSTGFMSDGAFVYVPDDLVVKQPIQLLFLASAPQKVVHPRSLIVVGNGAAATVVERYVGTVDATYWTNAVTEAVVEENARLDLYRIQQESEQSYHTATTQAYQRRDSWYSLTTVALGSALTRHDINAVLDGRGAECRLYGLSQLSGRQHVDNHTTIDHAQPHCNSWEYFNGIYDDQSRGVFTGRIIVRPDAQKTDSKQTNNNLLLSERARADSQPQLEIYADDVKCTHGATLGPIDERALFYLQSRGLGAAEARSTLTYGFGVEILNQIAIDGLRQQLDALLHERLEAGVKASGSGR